MPNKASTTKIDDTSETVNSFLDKVAVAQTQGQEWVETTPEVFKHFMRNDPNSKFFHYGNPSVKVCRIGDRAGIEKDFTKTVEQYQNELSEKARNM